jgi:hypothetical protein
MKKLITLIALSLSLSSFAQHRFKVTEGQLNLRSLKFAKTNHLIILGAYRSQIDSEIKRLATGIQIETNRKAPKFALSSYDRLMVDLIVKRIFVTELENQLKPVDFDKDYHVEKPKKIFNTEAIKINLEKQIGVHLDQVLGEDQNLGHHFLEEFKHHLIVDTVKHIAVHTYKSIGSGLLAKVILNGVSGAAVKSAVISMGSEVFVSAGTATILSILTFPLHAYRLPPEHVWTDILEKHPELILNPEWMRYAGSSDDPWYSHGYAILRRTEDMEKRLSKFLKNEENEFKSSVTSIYNIKDLPKEVVTAKEDFYYTCRAAIDNTRVCRPIVLLDIVPYWAGKR